MVSPLDRKLFRDLRRMRGQAGAIALVISVGTLLMVLMDGLVGTLEETRSAYYERYRIADVFAPATRVPARVLHEIREIPGVASVVGRVIGAAQIDLPDESLPIHAQAVSLPPSGKPRLNDILLTDGRWLDADHADEVLVLNSFAAAQELRPGDTLDATLNGARRTLRIVGLAQSPEFLYSTPPGEFLPDDARFSVLWMNQSTLAAAYDMGGAFNEALLSLANNSNEEAILASIDRLLRPFGGRGAYALAEQFSNRFVSEEIGGLRSSSVAVPPIFLGVAAFLLFIVVTRIIQSEREQIGLLKAFGYTSAEVSLHYFKLVVLIALAGAIAGSLMGVASGRAMAGFYQNYFKFPFLVFQLDAASIFNAILASVLSASLASLLVLRRVFQLTPAVAMRPPAPADYSNTQAFGATLRRVLDQPSRMILRRVLRQPGRMLGAIIGISTGMGLAVSMGGLMIAFDRTLDITFSVIDRSDAAVSFIAPLSNSTVNDLKHMDGVIEVEPFRVVPVLFRNGFETYRGAINGLVETPSMFRALDEFTRPIRMREDGIILSEPLADILGVAPGDEIEIEVQEGRQPVLRVSVAGIARSLLGAPTYMELGALNRLMGEPDRVSGAYLRIDSERADTLYRQVKKMPLVAGMSIKEDSRKAFEKQMDTGAGAMRYVMAAIAAVITFGIVYNAARIAFAEGSRDLASLRVIGFSRGETAYILLGELGVVTLAALPVGAAIGYFLSFAIASGFSTDLYQIPVIFTPQSYGTAMLAVIAAAIVSGLLVKRDLDGMDLVASLKTRE